MIWGGARAKAGKKKLNGYSPRKKKTQLNNPEEKKNSTQQPRRKKKLNSTTWKKKKTQLNNLEEKKIHHGLYAGLRCPEHGHTCFLHTI